MISVTFLNNFNLAVKNWFLLLKTSRLKSEYQKVMVLISKTKTYDASTQKNRLDEICFCLTDPMLIVHIFYQGGPESSGVLWVYNSMWVETMYCRNICLKEMKHE